MMTPVERVLEALRERGAKITMLADGTHMCQCQSHPDNNPSLHVSEGDGARALLDCKAGCSLSAVLESLGMREADLFVPTQRAPPSPMSTPLSRVGDYFYTDATGAPVMKVTRYVGLGGRKTFRQYQPDGHGGWRAGLNGVTPPLYRLPEVLAAVRDGRVVLVVEGEKDADRAVSLGLVATTNPMGAGKWRPEHTEPLRDGLVSIIVDDDEPGRKHALSVYGDLSGAARSVGLLLPAEGCKDLSEHLDAGHGLAELRLVDPIALTTVGAPVSPLRAWVLSRDELAGLPTPAPLIADTLDLGTVAILAGYWGTLKSFLVQHMSASVATGEPWLARGVERRRVLFLAPEGAHGLHGRWAAWEYTWHRGESIPSDWLSVFPRAVQLADDRQVAELCSLVSGEGYGLVVIDTLAKCMVGLEENAARDMGRVVDALYRVQEATAGGTVLGTHHTGKDRLTVRGSSALEAGVDTVYQTDGVDTSMIKLSRTKRRDGPVDDTLTCGFTPVEGSGTGVVMKVSTDLGLKGSSADLMSIYLSTFEGMGCTRADLRAVANMPPGTFHRAVNALVKDGLLIKSGSDARPFLKEP